MTDANPAARCADATCTRRPAVGSRFCRDHRTALWTRPAPVSVAAVARVLLPAMPLVKLVVVR